MDTVRPRETLSKKSFSIDIFVGHFCRTFFNISVNIILGRLNKIPVIRSHFVIFICATNCFNKMWYLIQWKVGFYSHESGILLRQIWKWNCGVLFSIWFTFHICLFIHVIQLSFEISFSGNNGIKTRILFSGIDKERYLINLFWDPIQMDFLLKTID